MKITLEMLLTSFFTKNTNHIKKIYPVFTADIFPQQLSDIKDIPLNGVRLFPKSTKNCSVDYLYIADKMTAAELKKLPANIPVICFSIFDVPENSPAHHTNVIWVYSSMEFADAFNNLMECYNEFVDWGEKLDFAVFRDASFQELLDITESMIDSPILVYDPALKLLAYSKKYSSLEDKIFQNAIKNGYMELEAFKYFEESRAFEELHASGSSSGEADSYRDHTDNLKAININNELAVYCVLIYTSTYPKTYINALYQVLCDTFYNLLKKQHSTFKKDRSVTDYFLMDLLDNPDTPAETIQERLYYNDLDFEGNYVLMTVHSDIQKKSSEKYFIQLLRNNLINCRIFSYKQSIVILYHLPQSEQRKYRSHIIGQMQPLLENAINNNITVFVSRPFKNIGFFSAAYMQAESIPVIFHTYFPDQEIPLVKYQPDKNSESGEHTEGYYFYENYCITDLFLQNGARDPIYNYCEPFLLDLASANTKKSRQLLEILYEYLKSDRKLTVVAEKLDMHRNNVLYHIQQISENYQVDLDDYETKLKLMLSFELLKLTKNAIKQDKP